MDKLTAEIKIISASVLGSIVLDIEMLFRFLIPIVSAASWYFIKIQLDKWRKKRDAKTDNQDT